jgi:hypothetical protein
MPKYTIKAGEHYHQTPPLSTLPWLGKPAIARNVTFDSSCAYDSAPYNAQDVNKLFGLSFGFGGVHQNSARFGWRWSTSDQCIELLAYVYKDGQRNWDEQMRFPVIAQINLAERVECELTVIGDKTRTLFRFQVRRVFELFSHEVIVEGPRSLPKFGLTQGFYFGGELVAPHEMSVQLDCI